MPRVGLGSVYSDDLRCFPSLVKRIKASPLLTQTLNGSKLAYVHSHAVSFFQLGLF